MATPRPPGSSGELRDAEGEQIAELMAGLHARLGQDQARSEGIA